MPVWLVFRGALIPQDAFSMAKDNGYFIFQRRGDIIESFTENLIAS